MVTYEELHVLLTDICGESPMAMFPVLPSAVVTYVLDDSSRRRKHGNTDRYVHIVSPHLLLIKTYDFNNTISTDRTAL